MDPGGKKPFYPHVHMPLVAIDDLRTHAANMHPMVKDSVLHPTELNCTV